MKTEQDTAQYLLDQVARLTAENAMLKEKWLAQPESLLEGLREDLREGISLRDHFAGLAMQGLLSSDINTKWDEDDIALIAYGQADAMLKRREKK